ncbi:hypothetical protein BM86_17045 [Bacillus thuringiensis]|uniref:SpaA-like prealbumin fold domain-containing protein n=1 Tax=Bacillus thuringiensis TaxID=1428 RepID=A0A9W3X446_BACTU|nr:hypothetical protein BT246_64310 [Bacillus thuringiensis]MBH0337132.1 hypothetical protein [Bacillus thuringiensis]
MDRWKAVYLERGTYGLGGSIWKPIVEIQKGAGCLPYGNNKLPNAEFTIFNEQGKEVAKGKTNENGIAKFKLPYGKYTYKETFAPNGCAKRFK